MIIPWSTFFNEFEDEEWFNRILEATAFWTWLCNCSTNSGILFIRIFIGWWLLLDRATAGCIGKDGGAIGTWFIGTCWFCVFGMVGVVLGEFGLFCPWLLVVGGIPSEILFDIVVTIDPRTSPSGFSKFVFWSATDTAIIETRTAKKLVTLKNIILLTETDCCLNFWSNNIYCKWQRISNCFIAKFASYKYE